jgi:hypothetical protein
MSQSKYDPRQLILNDLKKLRTKYEKKAFHFKNKVVPERPVSLALTHEKYLHALEAGNWEEAEQHKNRYDKAMKQAMEPIEKTDHYIKMQIMYGNAARELGNMIFLRQLKEGS